jgi:hypothetical protein
MAPPRFGSGFQPFFQNNSDNFLSVGLGLLSGKTPQEQVGQAASNFANERTLNKTAQYIKSVSPELGAAIENKLISPADAYKMYYQQKLEAQKPKKPIEVNGRLVDPDTYKVIADFSDQGKPTRSFQTLPNGDYGFADPATGTFVPLGSAPKPQTGPLADLEERKRAATAAGLSEGDPTYQGFILTGKMPREDAQTLTPTDKKALWAAEDEVPALDNTISSLKRAKELNRKTFTGVTAGTRGWLGTAIPGGDLLVDGEAAKATSEFNKTMSMEAIQSMAQTLKGATTDAELERFVSILADPATDPDIRERTIDRMIALSERVKEVKMNRINELRGNSKPSPGGGTGRATSNGLKWSVE